MLREVSKAIPGLDFHQRCMPPDIKPVSESSTMILLGAGLIGLAGWGREKSKKR